MVQRYCVSFVTLVGVSVFSNCPEDNKIFIVANYSSNSIHMPQIYYEIAWIIKTPNSRTVELASQILYNI